MRACEEFLLQGVTATSVIRSEETVSKDEKFNNWREKRLYGQFVREIP